MTDNDRLLLGLPLRTAVWYSLMILAACVSYSILWREAPVRQGDSSQYLEVARDLADGRIDALHDRTPGYPLLLVVTGSAVQPTRALFFASLLLHFASIWLLATVLHSSGVRRGWLLTFAAVLLLPPYVEPAAYVMSENLAQFTLVVGFACLVLWCSQRTAVWLVASTVAFGYSAVTRPANQALTPIICLCLLLMPLAIPRTHLRRGDAARAGTALLAGTLLIVGAVSVANYVRFDYFGLTPMSGFHLSTKTMPFVERLPDRYATVREILIRERDSELTKRGGLHTGSQAVWAVRPQLQAATGLSQPQLSAYLFKMNIELIGRAPVEYLQEVMRSASGYWFPAAGPLANMSSTVLVVVGSPPLCTVGSPLSAASRVGRDGNIRCE
jgi:hypothetical protein